LVLFSSLGAIPKIVKDNIRFHSDAAPQRRWNGPLSLLHGV
jgi:hypothetical protein